MYIIIVGDKYITPQHVENLGLNFAGHHLMRFQDFVHCLSSLFASTTRSSAKYSVGISRLRIQS
jgi:hypothetical protein